MDVCALCNLLTLAPKASTTPESRNTDMTECVVWTLGLFICFYGAIKQSCIESAS